MDLKSFYDKYGYNIKKDFERHPMLRGQLTTPDGKMFFFPSLVSDVTGPVSLIVTQSYVKNLGLQMPSTLDDLKNLLIQIRDKDANGNGDTTDEIPFVFPKLDIVKVFSGIWGIDLPSGYTADKDGKLFYSYTSNQYRTFLTYLNELFKEGLINEDFVKQSSDTRSNLYANNRVGVLFNFPGNAANYTKKLNKNWNMDKDELDYMPIMPLTGGTDSPYYIGRDALGERFAINANCKEQTAIAAFSFMDYCMGDEAYLLHNFGHEGESYRIDEKGLIHDIPNPDVEENADKYGSWFKGIPDNEGFYQIYSGPSYDTIVGKISKEATRIPTILSTYMKEDEISVATKYETDLQTYVDEMLIKFITGNESLQAWDNYVSKCESLGAKDLVPVKQAIYDRLTGKN
jgi:putative aldouronate transport system substrate-binding protein